MPIYVILIAFYVGLYFYLPVDYKVDFIFRIFIFSVISPVIATIALISLGLVNNIYLKNKRERIFPLIITVLCYYLCYYFVKITIGSVLQNFFVGVIICTFAALIVSTKWKISNHLIGIGGLVGFLLAINFRYLININFELAILLILSGILLSVRVYLQEHSFGQVIVGFFVGLFIILGIMVIL